MPEDASVSRAERQLERLRREAWQEKHKLEQSASLDNASCPVCKSLSNAVTAPFDLRIEVSLGRWAEIAKSDCINHSSLFPAGSCPPDPSQELLIRKPARQQLFYVLPDLYRILPGRALLEAPWEAHDLYSQSSEIEGDEITKRAQPRLLDPDYIDFGLLKAWLATCQEQHGDKCSVSDLADNPEGGPYLLVDVFDKCLIDSTAHSYEYVALSYVWGSTNHFITTRDNVHELNRPGALEAVDGMPRTISEAIGLTRILDLRYLWVDALCIVQDHESQHQQLNAMASIFANACLTVVHADGADANAGFRGLRNISSQRQANQRLITPNTDQQMVKPSSRQVWSGSMLEPWITRAWTFQEEVCSRRVLYFAHDSVRWVCKAAHWSEESESDNCIATHASAEQLQLSLSSPKISASPMPQLAEYEALVNGFNVRTFTFPEDALSAFAGVATGLGNKYEGGLISGLPELFFDIALLWRPTRRKGVPLRRRPAKRDHSSSILPSWSWAGWDTEMALPFTWNYSSEIGAPPPVLLGNIRPFYQIKIRFHDDSGNKRISIQNSWASYASHMLDKDTPLPVDWTRREARQSSFARQADFGEELKYYTHSSDRDIRFWFPIPLAAAPSPPRNPQHVAFTSTCGSFKIGTRNRDVSQLLAPDDVPVGMLWPHDESDPEYVNAFESGTPIQLVAILGCTVHRDGSLSNWKPPDDSSISTKFSRLATGPPSRLKEVYAVLWIHWDEAGEIAYRKGTGEVVRELWERYADTQRRDILLG